MSETSVADPNADIAAKSQPVVEAKHNSKLKHRPVIEIIIASHSDIDYCIELFHKRDGVNSFKIIVLDSNDTTDASINPSPDQSNGFKFIQAPCNLCTTDLIYIMTHSDNLQLDNNQLKVTPLQEPYHEGNALNENKSPMVDSLLRLHDQSLIEISVAVFVGQFNPDFNSVREQLSAVSTSTLSEYFAISTHEPPSAYFSVRPKKKPSSDDNPTDNDQPQNEPAPKRALSRDQLLKLLASLPVMGTLNRQSTQWVTAQFSKKLFDHTQNNALQLDSSNYRKIIQWLNGYGEVKFNHYRQSWLAALITQRAQTTQCEGLEAYVDFCIDNDSEYQSFVEALSPAADQQDLSAFYKTAQQVCKLLMLNCTTPDSILRVWVAGCGYCEEAYLFAAAWFDYCSKYNIEKEIKIFATDVQASAIRSSSRGLTQQQMDRLTGFYPMQKWVTNRTSGLYELGYLRKSILFSRHDLTSSPTLPNMDLIVCRHLLKTFKQGMNHSITSGFHNSLNTSSYLLLENCQLDSSNPFGFCPVDEASLPGLYQKKKMTDKNTQLNYTSMITGNLKVQNHPPPMESLLRHHNRLNRYSDYSDILDQLIDEFVPPGFLINQSGHIVHIFGDTTPITVLFNDNQFSRHLISRTHPLLKQQLKEATDQAFSQKQSQVIELDKPGAPALPGRLDEALSKVRLKYFKKSLKKSGSFCGIFFIYKRPSTT